MVWGWILVVGFRLFLSLDEEVEVGVCEFVVDVFEECVGVGGGFGGIWGFGLCVVFGGVGEGEGVGVEEVVGVYEVYGYCDGCV